MQTTLAHAEGPPPTRPDELIWIGSIARLGAAAVRIARQSDAFA